ncbi:MAG: hypothetical protein PHQ58_18100 [Rhodoferax sp.]|uniref:hypothetical protein n=1 Tax=Rhodoferax sp. TaxID=50421 RepID=UPI002639D8FC|nr:hypothetical protein [Rhodoferax sp.]MDD2882342.1 hypothetical protein [Rhodoferax sp.]
MARVTSERSNSNGSLVSVNRLNVLARELWPKGIHVAHVVIDADIDEGDGDHDGQPHSDPNDIAQLIVDVHRQPRSAWMSEADIRPWNEQFWQHC